MSWTEEDYQNYRTRLNMARMKGSQKARPLYKPVAAEKPVAADVPVLEMVAPVDKPKRRKNNQYEFAEQCAYFAQVDAAVASGQYGAGMIYAVTNSNVAGAIIGKRLVMAGLRRGVPDISIMVPSQDFHAAFIELKQVTGKPSDLSEYQREWIRNLNDMGYKAVVCFGAKEALDFTSNYLGWAE